MDELEMKKCGKCKVERSEDEFAPSQFSINNGKCRHCVKEYKAKYYQENKKEINKKSKINRDKNKEKTRIKNAEKYKNNKEERKAKSRKYYQENKEEINKKRKGNEKIKQSQQKYKTKRRKEDLKYRILQDTSTAIRMLIKNNGGSKNGRKVKEYLPWTVDEYIIHMETLFTHPDNLTPEGKVWMTFNNRGLYNPNIWDDNNPMTWTWQLDHIIPKSEFNITSMDSQEFRDCWSLSNLRPLSAKQNVLDGVNRARHKDK